MSSIAKKNHYNPCFWTAYWNKKYHLQALKNEEKNLKSRNQIVRVLNLRADKIFREKVENIHYDKEIGIAPITKKDALNFCKRNFPDEYDGMKEFYKDNPETVFINGEELLTGLEKSPAYEALINFIKQGRINSITEKTLLAGFLILHQMRGHALLNAMIELYKKSGLKKFEYFWTLKHTLSNRDFLFKISNVTLSHKWTIYSEDKFKFPLSDSPIINNGKSILATLSPKHLLEIDLNTRARIESEPEYKTIPPRKFLEFKRRTINNTFKEIIFSDKQTLRRFQRTKDFKKRVELVSNLDSYNKLVEETDKGEIWEIDAFSH